MNLDQLRFPIGRFEVPARITAKQVQHWIDDLDQLPTDFRRVAEGLTQKQLDTPYRPGGWTLRQVIHHVPDSHMNSYVRFRWALTENNPTIKAYDEVGWATLPDASTAPIHLSLDLLESLHKRWVVLLRSLSADELKKSFVHPSSGQQIPLDENIGAYAWHGRHHLGHLKLVGI
ncbi:MAG: YfiT family bacillithiol transferase [Bacteroidota bacterium]